MAKKSLPKRPAKRQAKRIKIEPAATAEIQVPWKGRHNYQINSATVLRDAYRLLCLVMAEERIAKLSDSERDPLAELRDQFVEDELVHLLISTAIMNRAQDDHMSGPRHDAAELSFAPPEHECGSLVNNVEEASKAGVPLNFREACNKIIHADHITAEIEQIEDAAYEILPLALVLRGRHGKNAWQASLNVPEYVRGTFKNFQHWQ